MGINLAVPWNQQMSQGKRYLSKNLRRWEICLAFIEKAIIQMSKIIFYLQFQNMDLLLKTNAFSLMKYTNKLRPRYVILISFLFQYLTMFVDDFNFEVFEQFMQHLSLCADSYRAASNREQRRIVLTNLFISCDHSGVSQPSKVFRLPGILQIDLYPLV